MIRVFVRLDYSPTSHAATGCQLREPSESEASPSLDLPTEHFVFPYVVFRLFSAITLYSSPRQTYNRRGDLPFSLDRLPILLINTTFCPSLSPGPIYIVGFPVVRASFSLPWPPKVLSPPLSVKVLLLRLCPSLRLRRSWPMSCNIPIARFLSPSNVLPPE